MFRSRNNRPETIPAETGNGMVKEYAIDIDEYGHKELVEVGERNVYEEIQEYKDITSIENIITKCMQGDTSVLNAAHGQYFDATEMPRSLAEAQQIMNVVRNEFYTLPAETRNKFNNAPEEYIAAYGSEDFYTKLGINPIDTVAGDAKVTESEATSE